MTLDHNQDVQAQLRGLRERYLRELPGEIALLQDLWVCWRKAPDNAVLHEQFARLLHGMVGSGATFGCPRVSEQARTAYTHMQRKIPAASGDEAPIQEEMGHLLAGIASAAHECINHASHCLVDTVQPAQSTATSQQDTPLVYLVDDDRVYGETIATAISAAGYEVCVIDGIAALDTAVNSRRPAALIMDMMLREGEFAGEAASRRFAIDLAIPTLFLTVREDLVARLAAVRAGASAYFTKPVDVGSLVRTLDRMSAKAGTEPYRVLLVDDDLSLATHYAAHLEQLGMRVRIVHHPAIAMDQIAEFDPELIVLDIEMPEINGLELGAIIRQFRCYDHVPIVFLTADTTIQARIASMRLGGDDFLIKPIAIEFLAESLQSRLERARSMRNGRLELQTALRQLRFVEATINEHAIVSATDLQGNITQANGKFLEISGYTEAELIGQNHRLLKSGEHSPELYEALWQTISSGKAWQGCLTNRAKDGSLYDVFSTVAPQLDEFGLPSQYLSIRTDITAIRRMERTLALETDRLSLALDASHSGLWEWNLESGTTLYSDSWRKLFGYAADQAFSWPQLIHPDDMDETLSALFSLMRGDTPGYVSQHRIRNARGEWDWVMDMGRAAYQAGDETKLVRVIGTTQLINDRVAMQAAHDALQAQLGQAMKMEAIGHLTAGVAHDFNNLLGGILGYAELAFEHLRPLAEAEKIRNHIRQITSAGERARDLIAQMLLFSRLSPEAADGQTAPVIQVNSVIKEVAQLLRSSIPSTIEVNHHATDDEIGLRMQPVHLHQILMNLAINAKDAIRGYGRIDIHLERSATHALCSSCQTHFSGEYAVISVMDSGEGMDSQIQARIFDPFYTTKEVGKGTGMGLSVVHGLVHSLQGHIILTSSPGNGTQFRIYLPLVNKDDAEAEKSPAGDGIRSFGHQSLAGLHIMVVDDEQAIASMLHELLTSYGARVSTHTDARQAWTAFESNPDDFDLVVTDETMPRLSGLDLIKAMRRERIKLPVILCTGYSEQVDEHVANQHGVGAFMRKPVDLRELLTQVQRLTSNLNTMG